MSEDTIATTATDIFLKAAAYIRRYGWQQEGMGESGGPRCSMGALESAYPSITWDTRLAQCMYQALYDTLDGLSLTQFNSRYQSGEKVAELYERVAAKLKQNRLQEAGVY